MRKVKSIKQLIELAEKRQSVLIKRRDWSGRDTSFRKPAAFLMHWAAVVVYRMVDRGSVYYNPKK